jgi:purine-binding chemotaxis protein CheW
VSVAAGKEKPPTAQDTHSAERIQAVIVTTGTRAYAIPVEHVVETMRPLSIEPIGNMPNFVRGVSIIRGVPIPVVDLEALLENGTISTAYGRFVTVNVGERRVAIGVNGIIGVRRLDSAELEQLPPLLQHVDADLIDAIGTYDAQFLVMLRVARIIPDHLWTTLTTAEPVQ